MKTILAACLFGCALVILFLGYGLHAHRQKQNTRKTPQPLLDNRCFQSKTAMERKELVKKIDALPEIEFNKTVNDLEAVNASDRLLGYTGCQR
jgi:hypothetical protein